MTITKKQNKQLASLVKRTGSRQERLALNSLKGTTGHLNRRVQSLTDRLANAQAVGESLVKQVEELKAQRHTIQLMPANYEPVMMPVFGGAEVQILAPKHLHANVKRQLNVAELEHIAVMNWEQSLFKAIGSDGVMEVCDKIADLKRLATNSKQIPLRVSSALSTFLSSRGEEFGLNAEQCFNLHVEFARELAHIIKDYE